MSYRGNWTPGGYMWVGADQQERDTIAVPNRRGTALSGTRNGLPEGRAYVWQAEGRAREITVNVLLERMRARVMASLDVDPGPGYGAHAYGTCPGECPWCVLEGGQCSTDA